MMLHFIEAKLRQHQGPMSDTGLFDLGPKTAFGKRLLELADLFHRELLEDEVIVFYLDELAFACEAQMDLIEGIGSGEGL